MLKPSRDLCPIVFALVLLRTNPYINNKEMNNHVTSPFVNMWCLKFKLKINGFNLSIKCFTTVDGQLQKVTDNLDQIYQLQCAM